MPTDFMRWNPTCHHNGNIIDKAGAFLNMPGYMRLPLFYVWGHSFEFARENNWELIEQFCELVAFREDTWYTTNIDYMNYVTAMRSLIFSTDASRVFNPSAFSVWLGAGEDITELKPGETVRLPVKQGIKE